MSTPIRASETYVCVWCGLAPRGKRTLTRYTAGSPWQAIRDELAEREKEVAKKEAAKEELHAKHGALSRFAK